MKRVFLFLQGSSCRFFPALGRALAERGYGVCRINASGGDWYFWRDWNAVDYKGAPQDFGSFVGQKIQSDDVTDLVLYNDCRPLHRLAIEAARELGCRIWVFEEGYLRPYWLTLEEEGVNGYSPLFHDRERFHLEVVETDGGEPPYKPTSSALARRVFYDFQWQGWNYLLRFRYPQYRTHRPFPIWAEYATWTLRLARLPWSRRRAARSIEALTRSGERYYVFPMQLDSDSQVTAHSEFTGMEQALEHVIGSFAVNAPRDTQIVVKLHPLDNGWINFRRLTDAIAARWGVSSRVTFIDGGNLDALVDGSLGVVTLNSTVGLSALKRGKPVICLAKAIFDVPGLTFQGDIDRFWGVERGPDNALLQRFLAYLTRRALIVGDFYTAEGVALAVTNAIDRFEAVSVPEAAGSTGQSWVSQSDTRSEECRSTKPAKRSVS
jgi:capsular polysaccharide export protein